MDREGLEEKLVQVATEALALLPETVESIEDVRDAIKTNCAERGDSGLEAMVFEVFQLATINQKGTFSRGFPGIVLTAIAGRMLDSTYKPTQDFYRMRPRAVFEKHIAPVLRTQPFNAPMGKSDPLNVAKGIGELNEGWARVRRPASAAHAALHLIRKAEVSEAAELEKLLSVIITAYVALGKLFAKEYTDVAGGVNLQDAYAAFLELMEEAPAGGDTAQAIIGACLQAQHDVFSVEGALSGVGESVFATNTTSGKPGDFTEELGTHLIIYEVSVKRVDEQRLAESAASVRDYLDAAEIVPSTVSITFLTRPQDVQIDSVREGFLVHSGLHYNFVNIYEWIRHQLERLGPSGRKLALKYVSAYAQQISTPYRVKTVWADVLGSFSDSTE